MMDKHGNSNDAIRSAEQLAQLKVLAGKVAFAEKLFAEKPDEGSLENLKLHRQKLGEWHDLILSLSGRVENAEAALKCLGSMEALTLSFMPNTESMDGKELMARIEFAREAIRNLTGPKPDQGEKHDANS